VRRYSARQLQAHLARSAAQPLILDVREPWEFQVCRLPDARLVPMRQIPTAIDGLDPTRETVVVCHHGIRSFAVARFLEQAGFTNVINLEGGVAGWARDVDPTMPTY
jgi:rhodanese-related sulfurtransferase